MNRILILFSLVVSVLISAPVFAADQDDADLGIVMKKNSGNLTEAQALEKSNSKLHKYENAKESIGGIFTGAPKKIEASPSPKPSPAAKKPQSVMTNNSFITLKNGEKMKGAITSREKNGVWVEVDPGVKVFFKNSELKEEKS